MTVTAIATIALFFIEIRIAFAWTLPACRSSAPLDLRSSPKVTAR